MNPYRPRLVAANWSESRIYSIEQQHRDLIALYNNCQATKTLIDKQNLAMTFNDCWDEVAPVVNRNDNVKPDRFYNLRQFAGGLATAFANTTTVESDFSILKWEMDEFRQALLNLSLEGIFQTKQFDRLMAA
jgi:hypothetical protein